VMYRPLWKRVFLLSSPDGAHSDEGTPDPSQAIYAEFDDDFEDEELTVPIGKCTAMYSFPGMSQAASAHEDVWVSFIKMSCLLLLSKVVAFVNARVFQKDRSSPSDQ